MNERAELETKLVKYRKFCGRITDDRFQKELADQIAELERKLREIDLQGRPHGDA